VTRYRVTPAKATKMFPGALELLGAKQRSLSFRDGVPTSDSFFVEESWLLRMHILWFIEEGQEPRVWIPEYDRDGEIAYSGGCWYSEEAAAMFYETHQFPVAP